MSFGVRLKNLRQEQKKSLQELADAVGISKAHLWELEAGKSRNPSVELLRSLSDYFKVSISFLVGEDPNDAEGEMKVMFRQLQELDDRDLQIVQTLLNNFNKNPKKGSGDGDQ